MARINSQLKEWFFCVVALAVVEAVGILVNSQLASPVDISDTITYAALVMLYFLTSYRYARRHPKRFYLIGVPLLLVILVLLYIREFGIRKGRKKLVISPLFCIFTAGNQNVTKHTSDDYQGQSYGNLLYY